VGPCSSPVTHFAPLSRTQQLMVLQLAFVNLPHFLSSSLLSLGVEVQNDPLLDVFISDAGSAACTLSLSGSLCVVFMPSTTLSVGLLCVPELASVPVFTAIGRIENARVRRSSGLAYCSVCVPSTISMDTRARIMSRILVNRENIVYRVLCTEKHRHRCANMLH